MRLVAISGAGRSLGARALLGTIPGLERALAASDKTALHSAIEALTTQKQVLASTTAALSPETEAESCPK